MAAEGAVTGERPSPPDVWSRDKLTGKHVSFKGMKDLPPEGEETAAANGGKAPPSPKKRKSKAKLDMKLDPMLWGVPGHLTDEEAEVYFKFKSEIEKRGDDFRSTVFCFGEEEGEVWALCRWLRARKFVYDDVITMVEEATECRSEAKKNDFYPSPKDVLGCEISAYVHHYPQLYSGVAQCGAPLYISKPGILNVDAVECLTTLQGILKFHWYVMMIDFGNRLRAQKRKDPHFKKFECFCILDLEHLTLGKLNQAALGIVKEQSSIDSLCFPETMNKMIIVNAPRFFSATWSLIKSWLDARTASKVDVISSRKQWVPKLLEFVDEDELPSDYGGKGPDTSLTAKEEHMPHMKRLHSEVMYVRGHGSVTFELKAGEKCSIEVHTRSLPGAKFSVVDADHKAKNWSTDVEVKHTGSGEDTEMPTHTIISPPEQITGPANIKVKADSHGGRWTTLNFLVVFSVV